MSTIIATTLSNGSVSVPTATVVNGSAKAWVNFNGTGTIAARDSFNLSSLTDNGTGDYTVTITNAMGNTDYTLSGAIGDSGLFLAFSDYSAYPPTTSAARIACNAHTGSRFDIDAITPVIHGDLA